MTEQASRSLTVLNARLWTVDGVVECAIHTAHGRVVRLADPAATQDVAGEARIDARGRIVTPGFIDAHFHAYGVGFAAHPRSSLSYIAHKAAQRLERALARGFTTVRDVCGGDPGIARALDEKLINGPRYLYTGLALSQTGGHGDQREPMQPESCCDLMCEVVDGVDAVRAAARERFRQGAHAIKMMTSGGVLSPTDPIRVPQYSGDEIQAAHEEAQRRGSYVAAHAYSAEAIAHSVLNGVRSIEHGNLLDQPVAELMRARDAFLVPTLAAYDAMARRGAAVGISAVSMAKNLEVLEHGMTAVSLAAAAGVRVGFGTDLMGVLEDEQLSGLRLQHAVQGTDELLRSVCVTNAALLQLPELGHLEPGSPADLLIHNRDPFDDPTVLWDTNPDARTVISAGVALSGS